MCHSCLRRSGVLRQDTARASQYLVRGADYLMDSQPLEHEIIETSYRGHNSCLSVGQKKLDFLPFFFFPSFKKLSGFTFNSGCNPC